MYPTVALTFLGLIKSVCTADLTHTSAATLVLLGRGLEGVLLQSLGAQKQVG